MNHRPRKRFGQHFLHDKNTLLRIVSAIQPKPEQNIVEIGSGEGALTFPLLNQCQRLTTIELDRDLIQQLQTTAPEHGELTIHNADALDFDFSTLQAPMRVVGNLPYNISTPLIFHLLKYAPLITDMHFLLQKEVVDRLCAQPGDKLYGRLSVMTQYHCQAENLFKVGPQVFRPPPKVDSAVIRLIPWSTPPCQAKDMDAFANLVRQAFSQRRKTLRRSLKDLANESDFEITQIDASLRPEQLQLHHFVYLSNRIIERN